MQNCQGRIAASQQDCYISILSSGPVVMARAGILPESRMKGASSTDVIDDQRDRAADIPVTGRHSPAPGAGAAFP